ncbi:MAG: ferritin-like domain-containing protein [Thiotrichales bacterium]|nr:ferritin-like domain-containing protein [Thiotrichales bacterium]
MTQTPLFECARQCLLEPTVEQTLERSLQTVQRFTGTSLVLRTGTAFDPDLRPVFPDKPRLIDPAKVSRRGVGSVAGRAALVHAIAHIEFNAIHLAWDAIYRFRNLPEAFYHDWIQVAGEETRHFSLLQERLSELGFSYGDLAAHDGLWRVAERTRHDPMIRMALVPRVHEARGLDVTPAMIRKLRHAGDTPTAEILEIIHAEEIGHVEIGSRWFRYLCNERKLDPENTFRDLVRQFYSEGLRGPYNIDARKKAGFSMAELHWLSGHTSG